MHQNKFLSKIVSIFALVSFLTNSIFPLSLHASELVLPKPGQFVNLSQVYSFPVLKGLRFDPADPLTMKFIIDSGHQTQVSEEEANKLIRYFFAGLSLPEKDIWVNLSPLEKDKIMQDSLASTDLGEGLLSQDYILKQISASLTYPEAEIGKDFWSRAYTEVIKIAKTTNVPVNTFNKIWIIPDQAQVYENNSSAFITQARLKAMLEEDYLLLKDNVADIQKEHKNTQEQLISEINKATSGVMRSFILPKINQDINSGKNFATLRQIYNSLILATWFKKKFQQSIYSSYIDKAKLKGIDLSDPTAKEKVYSLYLEAFQKGLYNYVKSEKEPATNKQIKRRYYSGGFSIAGSPATNVAGLGDKLNIIHRPPANDYDMQGLGMGAEVRVRAAGSPVRTILKVIYDGRSPTFSDSMGDIRDLKERLSGTERCEITVTKKWLGMLLAFPQQDPDDELIQLLASLNSSSIGSDSAVLALDAQHVLVENLKKFRLRVIGGDDKILYQRFAAINALKSQFWQGRFRLQYEPTAGSPMTKAEARAKIGELIKDNVSNVREVARIREDLEDGSKLADMVEILAEILEQISVHDNGNLLNTDIGMLMAKRNLLARIIVESLIEPSKVNEMLDGILDIQGDRAQVIVALANSNFLNIPIFRFAIRQLNLETDRRAAEKVKILKEMIPIHESAAGSPVVNDAERTLDIDEIYVLLSEIKDTEGKVWSRVKQLLVVSRIKKTLAKQATRSDLLQVKDKLLEELRQMGSKALEAKFETVNAVLEEKKQNPTIEDKGEEETAVETINRILPIIWSLVEPGISRIDIKPNGVRVWVLWGGDSKPVPGTKAFARKILEAQPPEARKKALMIDVDISDDYGAIRESLSKLAHVTTPGAAGSPAELDEKQRAALQEIAQGLAASLSEIGARTNLELRFSERRKTYFVHLTRHKTTWHPIYLMDTPDKDRQLSTYYPKLDAWLRKLIEIGFFAPRLKIEARQSAKIEKLLARLITQPEQVQAEEIKRAQTEFANMAQLILSQVPSVSNINIIPARDGYFHLNLVINGEDEGIAIVSGFGSLSESYIPLLREYPIIPLFTELIISGFHPKQPVMLIKGDSSSQAFSKLVTAAGSPAGTKLEQETSAATIILLQFEGDMGKESFKEALHKRSLRALYLVPVEKLMPKDLEDTELGKGIMQDRVALRDEVIREKEVAILSQSNKEWWSNSDYLIGLINRAVRAVREDQAKLAVPEAEIQLIDAGQYAPNYPEYNLLDEIARLLGRACNVIIRFGLQKDISTQKDFLDWLTKTARQLADFQTSPNSLAKLAAERLEVTAAGSPVEDEMPQPRGAKYEPPDTRGGRTVEAPQPRGAKLYPPQRMPGGSSPATSVPAVKGGIDLQAIGVSASPVSIQPTNIPLSLLEGGLQFELVRLSPIIDVRAELNLPFKREPLDRPKELARR